MAYIHVTSRCNMACAHCINDYSKFKPGKNMTLATFRNAMKWTENYGECVTLGGGEPTLNPSLKSMIQLAVDADQSGVGVLVVTNGSNPKMVEWMLDYEDNMGSEKFWSELSTDKYHDRSIVPQWVVDTYTRRKKTRDNGNNLIPAGRAASLDPSIHMFNKWQSANPCVCETPVCYPDGHVTWCGCKNSYECGNVNDPNGFHMPEGYNYNASTCWHTLDEEVKLNPDTCIDAEVCA